jgi:hypothetical protein
MPNFKSYSLVSLPPPLSTPLAPARVVSDLPPRPVLPGPAGYVGRHTIDYVLYADNILRCDCGVETDPTVEAFAAHRKAAGARKADPTISYAKSTTKGKDAFTAQERVLPK